MNKESKYGILIDSLRRLYRSGELTEEYINSRQSLTDEQKEYILSEKPIIVNYEKAYNELTDNSTDQPMLLRANIQALMASADSTSVINAEDFVDIWIAATRDKPIEHKLGEIKKYEGQVYKCCQAHTHYGEDGYEPIKYTAGWVIAHTTDVHNPKPYIMRHAEDKYMKDECVLWTDGKTYISEVDNNAYSPEEYPQNWTVYEE